MAERAIDKVRRASVLERRKLEVPEWGLDVWVRKVTAADMVAIRALAPDSFDEQNIHLVVRKAEDESGKPLFASGDFHYLLNEADYVVLGRVIQFINESVHKSLTEAVAAQKEELARDPSSASATT